MKLNRMIALCAMALAMTAGSLLAQDNGGGGGQGGGQGGGGGYRQRFDPQQMQQRIMDNIRDHLEFTNDTDWSAVQPLVQKVLDARRDADTGARLMRSLFRGRNRGGDNGDNGRPRGGMFGQPSPEEESLQNAVDQNVPAEQIKDLLKKYQAAQKAKREKLQQAQEDLRSVLTTRQEAQATLLGILD